MEEPGKLERIYRQYRNLMFYVANQILRNERDAEDAVHSAFVKLAGIVEKISEPVCPKTQGLVVLIVQRLAINQYNAKKPRPILPLDEVEAGAFDPPCEEREGISRAIARLPARYRELILLKFYQGFSDREIARMLDMTPGNVARTIQRAKQKLKENLEQEGIGR